MYVLSKRAIFDKAKKIDSLGHLYRLNDVPERQTIFKLFSFKREPGPVY